LTQTYELGTISYILSLIWIRRIICTCRKNSPTSTFNNTAFKELFQSASEKVIEGNKLSYSLQRSRGVKPRRNFMQGLALGEESSEVAQILNNIASLYREENDDKLKYF